MLSAFLIFLFLGQQSEPCGQALDALHRTRENISDNDKFMIGRGLEKYAEVLGHDFIKSLQSLRQGSVWIDSGAGEARAQRDYLQPASSDYISKMFSLAPWARCVALGYAKPECSQLQAFEGQNRSAFIYIESKMAEDVETWKDLARADVITDVFGPLTYSERPDLVLQNYLDHLQVGGRLHVSLPLTDMLIFEGLSPEPFRHSFTHFLSLIPGIELKLPSPHASVWMIEKKSEKIEVPRLESVLYYPNKPPKRSFRFQSPPIRRIH